MVRPIGAAVAVHVPGVPGYHFHGTVRGRRETEQGRQYDVRPDWTDDPEPWWFHNRWVRAALDGEGK